MKRRHSASCKGSVFAVLAQRAPGWCVLSSRRSWKCAAALAWLLLLCLSPGLAAAQVAAATDGAGLGHSVHLRGPWLAAPGDNPRWASADYDDSKWTVLPPRVPLPASFGQARSLWFRLHLHVPPHTPSVALYVESLPFNYSVYVNGVNIGGQGEVDPDRATQLHPPVGFPVPPRLIDDAGGRLVVALHVSGGPIGFLGYSPMSEDTHLELVNPEEVPLRQSFRLAHDWGESLALLAFNLLVGLCGLVIWWSLREQREYLALAVWLLCNALSIVLNFWAHMAGATPGSPLALTLVLVMSFSSVAELEFMRLLLKRPQNTLWLSLEAIAFFVNFFIPLLETGRLPLHLAVSLVFIRPLITEIFVGLVLLRGALRGNRDAPLLLLPMALWSVSDVYGIVRTIVFFASDVLWPDLPKVHVFSYTVEFATVATTVALFSLILIILRRTIRLSRERADLAAEVAAAEELQLLLMARASRPTPGYQVSTEYRPMQQVGGDFFLVQPCEEDGSLVVIVGDVSGKGLQAAMRVSMILGVLQREVMGQPDRVLGKLNRALLAQGDLGFTTACCLRLEADGSFCFANAGHLNPYLDGDELASEGALPLGMAEETSYTVLCGRMDRGQRIVLLSDGVVEARSRKGEMFGFDRTRDLVRMDASAMADVAQRFGQEDDITVLTLSLA